MKFLLILTFLLISVNLVNQAEAGDKVYLMKRDCPNVEAVKEKCTETKTIIQREVIKEVVIKVKEPAPNNRLSVVVGGDVNDWSTLKSRIKENEETGEKKRVMTGKPPKERQLYGVIYNYRLFLSVTAGVTYITNHNRTTQMGFVNLGFEW